MVGLPVSLKGWKACRIFVGFLNPNPSFAPSLLFPPFSSQCAGNTPEGKDFEEFIGTTKANEFRTLFTSWIHTIYRAFQFFHT